MIKDNFLLVTFSMIALHQLSCQNEKKIDLIYNSLERSRFYRHLYLSFVLLLGQNLCNESLCCCVTLNCI